MSEPALIVVEREGSVLVIALNRPAQSNAIDPEKLCRLADAWDTLDNAVLAAECVRDQDARAEEKRKPAYRGR